MYMDLIKKLIENGKISNDRTYGKGETAENKSVADSKGSTSVETTSVDGGVRETPQYEGFDSTQVKGGRKNTCIAKELKAINLTEPLIHKGSYHLNRLFTNKVFSSTILSNYLVQYTLNSNTKVLGQYKSSLNSRTKIWLFMWGKDEITGIDVSNVCITLGVGTRKEQAKEIIINYYDIPILIKKGILITGEKWECRNVPELVQYIIKRNLKNN